MTEATSSKNMMLGPGVIDTIISITVSETDGVASIGSPVTNGIRAMFAAGPSTSGIETSRDEEGNLEVALHISVYYGFVLPDLAEKLREAIANALMVQVGIPVSRVDIYIDSIQFPAQG